MKTLIPLVAALGLVALPVSAETIDSLITGEVQAEPAQETAPETSPSAPEAAPTAEPLTSDDPAAEVTAPEAVPVEERATTAPVVQELQPQTAVGGCTPEQTQALRNLGREYALSLVRNEFLGGQAVESLVENCAFDGTIYEGVLHVRWRGMLMNWNEYSVWGRLRTFPDGSNATFAPRGASEGVQSLQFWGNLGTIGLQLIP